MKRSENQEIPWKMVIIQQPIHIEDPFALSIWQKALWAKEAGYRQHYQSGILPLGEDDFIATHLILAIESEPIVMYKSIDRDLCQRFSMPFKGFDLFPLSMKESRPDISKILQSPENISYDSSWSMNPQFREQFGKSQRVRDMVTAMAVHYHSTNGPARWLTAGVEKLKIDKYFESMGCRSLYKSLSLPIIDGETVSVLCMDKEDNWSDYSLSCAAEFKSLWNSRLHYQPREKERQNAA